MENQFSLQDNEQFTAEDLMYIQGQVSQAFLDLINDAIDPGTAYAGLQVTMASATSINVAAGRLYGLGTMYSYPAGQPSINLFSFMPAVTQKIVAVVAWGQAAVPQNPEPRNFLINATTMQAQPQTVPTVNANVCNVNVIPGVESASPQAPTIPANCLLVALVTLGTTGIVSIAMQVRNQMPQLSDISGRTGALETWRAQTDPRVSTITSDLAKLAQAQLVLAPLFQLEQMAADVARLKATAKLPETYADYGADAFLDVTESDTAHAGYSAKVEEGIRFPDAGSVSAALALLNPIDPAVTNISGSILPAWTKATRMSNLAGFAGADYLSSFQFQTTTQTLMPVARRRIRFGCRYRPSSGLAYLAGREIPIDTACGAFRGFGEGAFSYDPAITLGPGGSAVALQYLNLGHKWRRTDGYWEDYWDQPYWKINVTTTVVTGGQESQVFLNAQDGWLTEIGLYFNDIGPTGAVQVSLCAADNGQPDLDSVLATVSIAQSALAKYPARTAVSIPPTFLSSGQRYAIVIQSGGQHSVCSVSGSAIPQGTAYSFLNGEWGPISNGRSVMFDLAFANFGTSLATVQLQSLSLAGGINSVDILTQSVCPSSCQIAFQAQVGGTWYALTEANIAAGVFTSAPNLVPLQAVFIGTPDVMPSLNLTTSQLLIGKAAVAFEHFSETRTLDAPTITVKVILLVENFDGAHHTVGCQLIVGGSPVTASVEADMPADSGINKQYSFTVTSTSSYVIEITGSTDSAADLFHVAERTDISF